MLPTLKVIAKLIFVLTAVFIAILLLSENTARVHLHLFGLSLEGSSLGFWVFIGFIVGNLCGMIIALMSRRVK